MQHGHATSFPAELSASVPEVGLFSRWIGCVWACVNVSAVVSMLFGRRGAQRGPVDLGEGALGIWFE